jgi:hypothetical protein
MPFKLSTTIGKIQNIPNIKNIEIVNEFLEYMRNNGSSQHHQNNNLKVLITFGNFIGKDNSFYDITKKEQIFITDMLGFHQEMSEGFVPDQLVKNYMNVHELLLLFTGIRYFWEKDKDVLENSLFVKDGPLMMSSQYSKLVEPIRRFIEFAQKKGYNINIISQEKSGDFFEHLQLIGKDAPLKTMFIPNDSYIKEEIKQQPKKLFHHLYGEKTNCKII